MSELYELPNGWEWKKLGDITTELSSKEQALKCHDKPYLSLENIESYTGNIINYQTVKESNIIGTCSNFNSSSVIYSKLRPYLNKVATPNFEGVGTTELIVFLPKENLNKYYLAYFLRSGSVVAKIDASSYGAKMPRASSKFLRALDFPLPPLPEQQRIVSKLDLLFEKIYKSIALHQKNMDEANAFMGSVLNDVFGELEEKYEKTPLFDVADVNRGKSKHRPRNDKKLFGGKYPFIQTGDVRNANKYIDTFTETYSEFGLSQSKLWRKGTICMTIAANIGDVAILNIDSCFPDSVVGIHSENNSNDFLYYFLLTLKQQLESQATTTAQMNINLKVLQTIGVPIPPLPIQQKTVTYLDEIFQKIEKIKRLQKEKMASLKALKASILDSAFRGEL